MPWTERGVVDERFRLVALYLQGEHTMMELAGQFGVSRKTAYKWVRRYRHAGPEGLRDRSRAPRSHPHAVSDEVVDVLLQARRAHPTWGPRKLLAWLTPRRRDLSFPAASTVGDILGRYGLTRRRGRSRRVKPFNEPFSACTEPNTVWCADFKGQFRLGDGSYCYPLTITDAFSRLIICCKALRGTKGAPVKAAFEEAFREFGLPIAIRTDNGTPFASRGPLRSDYALPVVVEARGSARANRTWSARAERPP